MISSKLRKNIKLRFLKLPYHFSVRDMYEFEGMFECKKCDLEFI